MKRTIRNLTSICMAFLIFFTFDSTTFAEAGNDVENSRSMIREISSDYNIDCFFVESIAWHESRMSQDAVNYDGSCVGIMQVSPRWHSERAEKLGVSIYDSYGNIKTACDYLHELFVKYEDPALVLMLYNMSHNTAIELYDDGIISDYATSVLETAELLRSGVNPFE